MIKGHQIKTKRSFTPMHILQTATRENCQGDTHLFTQPMLRDFFCSHAQEQLPTRRHVNGRKDRDRT